MSRNVVNPYQTFYDSTGQPRANGKIYFYVNETTTLATIWSDEDLTVSQSNPYQLDAYGRVIGNIKYDGLRTIKAVNSDDSDPITTDHVSTTYFDREGQIKELTYTTDIASDTRTPNKYKTIWYDSNKVIDSGAEWIYTGTRTAARAGDGLYTDGYVYNGNGDQYEIYFPSLVQYGGIGNNSANDTTAVSKFFALSGPKEIPDGTFLSDTGITLVSNTHIYGSGTIKQHNDSEDAFITLTNLDNVIIEDIKLDGNSSSVTGTTTRNNRNGLIEINAVGDGNTSQYIELRNLTIDNVHGYGIKAAGLVDSKIENCTVEDCGSRGIVFSSNCTNVLVKGNTVRRTYIVGIGHNGQGTMASAVGTSSRIRIIGNHVHDISYDSDIASSGIGIEMIGSTDGIIANNTVYNSASMCISTGFASNIAVVGNYCDTATYVLNQTQGFGIESTGVSDSVYSSNIIKNVRVGFFITSGSRNTYIGNSLYDTVRTSIPGDETYTRGFWLRASSDSSLMYGFEGPCEDHLITGNNLYGWHIQIIIVNPASNEDSIDRIDITNNKFTSPYDGIRCISTSADYSDLNVINNQFYNSYEYAARLGFCTRARFINNIVQGERNSGSEGIQFNTVVDTWLYGNSFSDITGDAADHNGCTGTAYIYNNIKDSGVGDLTASSNGYTSINPDSETLTGTDTASLDVFVTALDSSGGACTITCPDGQFDGQRKKFTMSDATTSSTVSVTSHETSDPEVFTFAQVTDSLILEWDASNAYWWTVKNIGAAT